MSLISRVFVGASGSPNSLRALRYARELAVTIEAALIPVHAWLPPGGDMADRRAPNATLRNVWQEAAWSRLWNCIEAAFGGPPDELEMWPLAVRGDAGQVLVGLANKQDDVIVLGAGRRGPIARTVHGRVARYCVAHAGCPVMAVPPSELARYGWRWPVGLSRHHGLAREAIDGLDHNIS